MARYTVAGLSTVAGSSARALVSLFGAATCGAAIREIKVANTTVTEVYVGVIRFSAATNVGAGLTEEKHDPNSGPALCTAFAGHTADGTTTGGAIEYALLGAAKGSGWVFTFGDTGLRITLGTSNGAGLYIPSGTGQICTYSLTWDE